MTVSGHCLCGATRFELTGPHNWVGHCHCDSCRRATASPMTTFIGHANGRWHWTGAEPHSYASSDHATRGFCGTCGAPVYYATTRRPDETHFYAALLDDPAAVTPTDHWHWNERLPWLHIDDTLTKREAP